MVVLFWTSLIDKLLPWMLSLIIFSDEFGGSQETAILEFYIKLHILTVFLTNLYVYLTVFQERHVNQTPISFKSPFSNRYCAYKYVKLYCKEDCAALLNPGRAFVGHNSVEMIRGLFSSR